MYMDHIHVLMDMQADSTAIVKRAATHTGEEVSL